MTDFEVIKGGASNTKSPNIDKVEKLKMLKSHMRGIDANMSAINQQANNLGWKELSDKTAEIRLKILDLLRLVKNAEKKSSSILSNPTKIKVVKN